MAGKIIFDIVLIAWIVAGIVNFVLMLKISGRYQAELKARQKAQPRNRKIIALVGIVVLLILVFDVWLFLNVSSPLLNLLLGLPLFIGGVILMSFLLFRRRETGIAFRYNLHLALNLVFIGGQNVIAFIGSLA